ncbi:Molybdopterin biosynthesis MoaE, partial [Fimicolochytrium jonesii]|uniref:Molybdopterin biosynthesis MoaE n=1 Tax=Fimicolochytrium jonesii TaxID=1396493 RepID=UPI0022FDCE52
LVELSSEPLDLTKLVDFVRSEEAGAISTFSGTTRNNFTVNGVKKRVLLLSYEAYEPMALSELRLIIKEAHVRYPTILKVGIAHRTGDVPVAEASVVIATSSPQRKDAMHATEWILDELKRRVPIWKKEVYDDGSVWKQNGE